GRRKWGALIQARVQQADGSGLSTPTQISARILKREPWSVETFLAGAELAPEADLGDSREHDGSNRDVAAARHSLKANANIHAVAFRLVNLDYDFLTLLALDRAERTCARPVEYAQIVEIAFSSEQPPLADRLAFL